MVMQWKCSGDKAACAVVAQLSQSAVVMVVTVMVVCVTVCATVCATVCDSSV